MTLRHRTRYAPPSSVLPWIICGLAAVFYCYEYLLRVTPSVMIPELMRTFNVSATTLGHLSAFYYYAYTPIQVPVGVLMDRFGPRFVLTLAVLSCAIGTALFGASDQLWVAATGRFLIGFGSAFSFVGVLKLATVWLPADRFAFVSGMATTLGMIGAMSGEIVLTSMVQELGWQNTVITSGFFGFILAPIIWLVVRDAPYQPRSIRRQKQQMRFDRLLKQVGKIVVNPQVWVNGLIGGLLFLPTTVFAELWGMQYLRTAHQLSPEQSAVAVSMIFLGWALGAPVAGYISDKIRSRRKPLFVGSAVASVLMIVLLGYNEIPYHIILMLLLVFGIFSGAQVICFAIGRELCSSHLGGTAVASTNFLIMLGGLIFQPIVGKMLDVSWAGDMIDGARFYTPEAYQVALMILPLGLILALFLTCFLKETHCRLKR